jgi:NNP family nitrate/nitrite transporter-like MFS transporter
MFAVWLMFGVLGIPIQKEFGISDSQLAWLASVENA